MISDATIGTAIVLVHVAIAERLELHSRGNDGEDHAHDRTAGAARNSDANHFVTTERHRPAVR
jgi:hypothetical protein